MSRLWVIQILEREGFIYESKSLFPLNLKPIKRVDASIMPKAYQSYDSRNLSQRLFLLFLSRMIEKERINGSFDQLILVAPPNILKALEQKLDIVTQCFIVGSITQDLKNNEPYKLERAVTEIVERNSLHPVASSFY